MTSSLDPTPLSLVCLLVLIPGPVRSGTVGACHRVKPPDLAIFFHRSGTHSLSK
jgi:hypothetical protein